MTHSVTPPARAYLIVSPGRNEAQYMRRTLDSVIAQTERPARWVIVDDGSTDESPAILADYAARYPWITVVRRQDRGHRAVGSGVIEAFYAGLETVSLDDFTYLCKLDLDLDLPPGYFAGLMDRMEADPRMGTCSGKTWYTGPAGQKISENISDEMSIGASKFMRVSCFRQIGGFVREVMWDGIDCHKARMLGWKAVSWRDPELEFEHLRPMGSSQQNIYVGRRRHGAGQWFMGSDPAFFLVTVVNRLRYRPFVLGALASLQGYLGAWWRGEPQLPDPELRRFVRAYQREVLLRGKARTVARIEAERAAVWNPAV
jgi:glycosyltransferase involved in cell wall biosynthesis